MVAANGVVVGIVQEDASTEAAGAGCAVAEVIAIVLDLVPRQYVGCRAVVEPDPRAAILLGEVLPHCDVIG